MPTAPLRESPLDRKALFFNDLWFCLLHNLPVNCAPKKSFCIKALQLGRELGLGHYQASSSLTVKEQDS